MCSGWCWLFEVGGIYIDADQGNRGRNEGFTDTSVRGHLYVGKQGEGVFCNGSMSFFEPQDPLVGAALERCVPTSRAGPPGTYGTSRVRA